MKDRSPPRDRRRAVRAVVNCASCGFAIYQDTACLVLSPRPAGDFAPGHIGNHARVWPFVCSRECVAALPSEYGQAGDDALDEHVRAALVSGEVVEVGRHPVIAAQYARLPEDP